MNKKFLALALLTVATVNARPDQTRTWGTDHLEPATQYHKGNGEIAFSAAVAALIAGGRAAANNQSPIEIVAAAGKGFAAGTIASKIDQMTGDPEVLPPWIKKPFTLVGGTALTFLILDGVFPTGKTSARRS